jgi:hypothetical protein
MANSTVEVPIDRADAGNLAEYQKIRKGEREGKPLTTSVEGSPAPPKKEDKPPVPAGEKPAGESGPAAGDGQEPQEAKEEKPPKRDRSAKGRAKELIAEGRIDEAFNLLSEAQNRRHSDEIQQLRTELQELRTRKPAEEPASRQDAPAPSPGASSERPANSTDPEPELKQYLKTAPPGETYEDTQQRWMRDHHRWDRRQTDRETQRATEQRTFQEKMAAARAKYPNFDQEGAKVLIDRNAIHELVQKVDNAMDVLQHLWENPEERTRIVGLSPEDQRIEVRILARDLKADAARSSRTSEHRPPPVTKVTPPGARVGGTAPPDDKQDPRTVASEGRGLAAYQKSRGLPGRR